MVENLSWRVLVYENQSYEQQAAEKYHVRLTRSNLSGAGPGSRTVPRAWIAILVIGLLALTFVLDRFTGNPHVEHLYYLPILLASSACGPRGGLGAALASVVLYHLAEGRLGQAGRSDVIQVSLFIAVGLFTGKLIHDVGRMRTLAMTDDLTGLHNLRSFEQGLTSLVRASRKDGAALAVLVLDVDRLKSLNDRYGHLAGAEAVRTVGQILSRHVPPDGLACRYGGDEFVVALPAYAKPRAQWFAATLCRAVQAAEPHLAGNSFPAGTLTVSVGVACRSFDVSEDMDEDVGRALFRTADVALYVAKSRGRNCVHAS
jgi:diguanylate cyclase (GGDEF)-like protein